MKTLTKFSLIVALVFSAMTFTFAATSSSDSRMPKYESAVSMNQLKVVVEPLATKSVKVPSVSFDVCLRCYWSIMYQTYVCWQITCPQN